MKGAHVAGIGGIRAARLFRPIRLRKAAFHSAAIHCSDLPLVERVARGHGIKAPLPFEHDLHGRQRTVFFD